MLGDSVCDCGFSVGAVIVASDSCSLLNMERFLRVGSGAAKCSILFLMLDLEELARDDMSGVRAAGTVNDSPAPVTQFSVSAQSILPSISLSR